MARRKSKQKQQDELAQAITGLSVLLGIYIYFKTQSISLSLLIFLIPILLMIGIMRILYQRKYERLSKSGILDIDKMSGTQFEEYLAVLFQNRGYKVKITKTSGDYGADLIIKKGSITTVIQAKRYSSKVGIKAVQEIHASMKYYNAERSMVVTNNYFTGPAIKLAAANEVELINRDKLIDMLLLKENYLTEKC
jgi:restriction system protein